MIVAVAAAGGVAGALGSLLGIGGGVFLVPFLNLGLGIECVDERGHVAAIPGSKHARDRLNIRCGHGSAL